MGKGPRGPDNDSEDPDEQEPTLQPDPDQPTFDDYGSSGDDTDDPSPPPSGADATPGGTGPVGTTSTGGQTGKGGSEGEEDDGKGDGSRGDCDTDRPQKQSVDDQPTTEDIKESDDADDADENDDEEQQEAKFIISTDPWDSTGWGNEPDLRRVEEMFGDKVSVLYAPLPPRTVEKWNADHNMPTVDGTDLPESTIISHKALRAAEAQDRGRAYLRRLRIAIHAEGRNIENKETLAKLAEEVGIDPDQLRDDLEEIETGELQTIEETPQQDVIICGIPHLWTGNIEYGRIYGRLIGEGVEPEPMNRPLRVFVRDNALVTTEEVMEVYQWDRKRAVKELESHNHIARAEIGVGEFWTSQ